jgi:protein phosphatase
MKTIEIPELSLVALIGASGSGKSTLARRHFLPTEVLSSDTFRGLVCDDENDQSCTPDAFDALYYLLAKRLARGKLTVVDATNVRAEDRQRILEHARKYHFFAVAIILITPEKLCHERNSLRPDRRFGTHVVHGQIADLERDLPSLEREGFRYVHILDAAEEFEIRRVPLPNNKQDQTGPFDIFGDLHGCAAELRLALEHTGWERFNLPAQPLLAESDFWGGECWRHPAGRKAIFLGDLVDRGPHVLDTLHIVHNMVAAGTAFCVAGDHDVEFARWLRSKQVQIKHGLEYSIAEAEKLPPEDRASIASFLDGLPSHYVFDGGCLVTAHAGLPEEMHGRASDAVREFCLYGETTGNWASKYRGKAMVVYGHMPVPKPERLNNTVNIDTGAVFGGTLTVLRYPEGEFVSVPAAREYSPPIPLHLSAPRPD